MADLGTAVISHKGLIVQGAEHPEYQVEDLFQAGCDNFNVTVPVGLSTSQGRAGGASPSHHLRAEEFSIPS